eukprot:CAMPEP_0113940860 /NCGR_PEP_ID=MMETSP1339-20121228/6901_1 /TAXON_ID=94617 /ORGANISM="Fibrocapsa japonica" /LENGTH=279 /DNA_ID=CAMNT_0000944823 /DNA_START=12 /DNA_END=851 /DNA_ORIENTATION=+ /assembly_acc=CAM_ASM_000762
MSSIEQLERLILSGAMAEPRPSDEAAAQSDMTPDPGDRRSSLTTPQDTSFFHQRTASSTITPKRKPQKYFDSTSSSTSSALSSSASPAPPTSAGGGADPRSAAATTTPGADAPVGEHRRWGSAESSPADQGAVLKELDNLRGKLRTSIERRAGSTGRSQSALRAVSPGKIAVDAGGAHPRRNPSAEQKVAAMQQKLEDCALSTALSQADSQFLEAQLMDQQRRADRAEAANAVLVAEGEQLRAKVEKLEAELSKVHAQLKSREEELFEIKGVNPNEETF